ncbi:hypothetical protein D9757_001062 [Collybiopsis confluens]|uniref:Methyltransferase type 11 domain-containing protein n=1 Tax=Collybiopsis confluens TaxID=2823264 RepID=A0A8H5MGC2_9AGAR|nr:hypothetical protein D9757_001062 [Collybiopsis confluens]
MIVKLFGNRLFLAPFKLETGSRVLESAAGTENNAGIWALEFFEEHRKNDIILNMDCIDISDRQFPRDHPSNMHFFVSSVTDLPAEWIGRFSFVHQRLLVSALNDTLWRQAISELFRVLVPGGWLELVEAEGKDVHYGIGPNSTRLQSIFLQVYENKGHSGDLTALLSLVEKTGFVDIQSEIRPSRIGPSGENGYSSGEIGNFFRGLKRDVIEDGGGIYGVTEEEYESLVQESELEWNMTPDKAHVFYRTIVARKP